MTSILKCAIARTGTFSRSQSNIEVNVTELLTPTRRALFGKLLAAALPALPAATQPMSRRAAQPAPLVRFGKTDLYVSRICQGTAFRVNRRDPEDEIAQSVLHRCLDVGINFFDSSNAYGWGGSELALGKAIRGRRSQLVICTKVHPSLKPQGAEPAPKVAFTREFATRELEGSLRRLGTDHVDVYLLHNPDGITLLEEVALTMDSLVSSGKVRYWGVSNHKAKDIATFAGLAAGPGHSRIAAIENHYNLLDRELEREMFSVLRRTGIALLPFSPLDEGRLLRPLPAGDEAKSALLAEVDRAGREAGASRAQVLLAWVLSHPEATCVLLGAETPQQVEENYGALGVTLSTPAVARLNAASDKWLAATSKTVRPRPIP
jgi:aryl-alcohol dehydrogenase-like predicted oxidoreductase